MKTLYYITIFLLSIVVSSASEEKEVIAYPPIKEVNQTSSEPKGLKSFSEKQLSDFLRNWKHVPKKEFYYESIEGVVFPMQEGTLTFEDGAIAKWRFYHCGGLRVDLTDGKSRYLLPKD